MRQDEDVLDTWFSSGLWPFATLGWPQETEDLKRYYPTTTMVTDRNIIYLWVARMSMMGLDFMKEIPFKDVFIYATVLTEDGRRMSKSLGTGVDPTEVIQRIGADALRYTLLSQTGQNQDIRYSERRTEDARNFCNKIWNAVRFVLLNVQQAPPEPSKLDHTDEWLLSRLWKTETTVRESYERFDLQTASATLYRFFWSEVCDWYIEISKSRLANPETAAVPQWVLLTSIEAFLKMLHPMMPFITEELYQHLPIANKAKFLMVAEWPQLPEALYRPDSERRIERSFEITRALRALRHEIGLTPRESIPFAYAQGDLEGCDAMIASQAWIGELRPGKPADAKNVAATVEGVDLFIPIEGLVDREKELERIERELGKSKSELTPLEARLANPQFVERAKPEIVERERAAVEALKDKIAKLQDRKQMFKG